MNLKPFIASTAVAAVLAGGALASATVSLLGPARDEAVGIVPADAFIYANVFLDPSTPQKLALKDLLAKFPEASTPEQATAAITRVLDEGLSEIGLSFATDVEPWVGSQISFFLMPPGTAQAPAGAVLIASDDPSAAQAALDKASSAPVGSGEVPSPASYSGVSYLVSTDGQNAAGVIDDFLVLGNEVGLRAVIDAADGDSLGEADIYQDAVDDLTEDRLATFYLDPGKAMAAVPGGAAVLTGGVGGPFGAIGQSAVSIIYARSDALVIETSSSGPTLPALMPTGATDLIEQLPGDSWAALGIPSLGQSIEQILTAVAGSMPGAAPGAGTEMIEGAFELQFGLSLRDDLLSWIGDVGLFAEGTQLRSLGGGAVIRATDPERAASALPKIKAALERSGAPVKPLGFGEFEGFALQDETMPQPINFVLADERVLIVYGRDATLAALGSDPSLGGTEGFAAAKASLGDGFTVSGYLDVDRILELVTAVSGPSASYNADVKPFLDPLSLVVFGSRTDGERVVSRVVIGVR